MRHTLKINDLMGLATQSTIAYDGATGRTIILDVRVNSSGETKVKYMVKDRLFMNECESILEAIQTYNEM